MSTARFDCGDRVRVAADYHWAQDATGTIQPHPDREAVGCAREAKSLEGMRTCYWVHFDKPQTDAEGDSCIQAEIDERYLREQPQA